MTSLPRHNATDATRALALEMFKDKVPCFMAIGDPPCPHQAAWVVYFTHLSAEDCGGQPPAPVCTVHRDGLKQAVHPFWRAWLNTDPIPCQQCSAEITIDRFEAIT
ncbi:hypothetical protein [Streptomyces sp. NPDC059009]|uniref:hypothetical protein n=1 Tax=Streptomyces sp. NPDC059009 TaxID=3346694 RepID=UPI00367ADAA0